MREVKIDNFLAGVFLLSDVRSGARAQLSGLKKAILNNHLGSRKLYSDIFNFIHNVCNLWGQRLFNVRQSIIDNVTNIEYPS